MTNAELFETIDNYLMGLHRIDVYAPYDEYSKGWNDALEAATKVISSLESGSSEIPNDLEEAAEISFDEAYTLTGDYTNFLAKGLKENQPHPIGPHWFCEYAKNRFIAGAKWDREQMMKEAVEWMVTTNLANRPVIYLDELHGFQYGDKVRIIIVKE